MTRSRSSRNTRASHGFAITATASIASSSVGDPVSMIRTVDGEHCAAAASSAIPSTPGHHQVRYEHIERAAAQCRDPGRAAVDEHHVPAIVIVVKHQRQPTQDRRIIIDEQNPLLVHCTPPVCAFETIVSDSVYRQPCSRPCRSQMAEPASTHARRRLALNARHAREQLGLTQEAAAEHIDCSVQALQRLERAAAAVTIDFVAHVAVAYKLDLADLFVAAGPWREPRVGRPPLSVVQASYAAERRAGWRRSKRRRG